MQTTLPFEDPVSLTKFTNPQFEVVAQFCTHAFTCDCVIVVALLSIVDREIKPRDAPFDNLPALLQLTFQPGGAI